MLKSKRSNVRTTFTTTTWISTLDLISLDAIKKPRRSYYATREENRWLSKCWNSKRWLKSRYEAATKVFSRARSSKSKCLLSNNLMKSSSNKWLLYRRASFLEIKTRKCAKLDSFSKRNIETFCKNRKFKLRQLVNRPSLRLTTQWLAVFVVV